MGIQKLVLGLGLGLMLYIYTCDVTDLESNFLAIACIKESHKCELAFETVL